MTKKYEDLTFTDDFMFCKILQNNEKLAKELVEMILGVKISRIERLEAQHAIEDSIDSKGIRLDVYFEDDENNVYDIEMQTYAGGNLPMRNRYYHSLIAVDSLNKGGQYNDIKHSYVIFICNFDPFNLGSPIYTARTRFDEHPKEIVEDGAVSVFLNCKSKSDKISPELQNFFKYIREKNASKGLTNSIENDLLNARNQKKWRREYMTLFEHEEMARAEGRAEGFAAGELKGKNEGLAEGINKGRVSSVDSLSKNANISIEEACKLNGFSYDDYKKAKESLN